jgi:hypothetical protein
VNERRLLDTPAGAGEVELGHLLVGRLVEHALVEHAPAGVADVGAHDGGTTTDPYLEERLDELATLEVQPFGPSRVTTSSSRLKSRRSTGLPGGPATLEENGSAVAEPSFAWTSLVCQGSATRG